ncbi:hypothetical protein GX408_06210 [bacterium]|nr:hypothetical protein [bacterium]
MQSPSLRRAAVGLIGFLILMGFAVMAAERPGILPPLPGEFLSCIPYEEYIDYQAPIPDKPVFDIRDYGAIGDGRTVNTAAINAAVQAAQAKKGVVVIQGGDFVSGTVRLVSGVTLHIAIDGVLRASRDSSDYDPMVLLLCEKVQEAVIEGPGRLLGEGEAWWKPPRKQAPRTPPKTFVLQEAMDMHFDAKRGKRGRRPSPLIRLLESSEVTVRNLLIENSPGWTLSIDGCEGVRVTGVVIHNNYHGPNTDGIDVVTSSQVEIRRCFVATGDDGIVLKNGALTQKSGPMSDIRVSDCTVMSSTNCFKIGTETVNDISDVYVSDCYFFSQGVWPPALSGLSIESVDGAHIERVQVANIRMRNCMTPLFIRLGNRNRRKVKDRQGRLQDVLICGVQASGAEFPCLLSGLPGLPIRSVTLQEIEVVYRQAKERLEIQNPIPEQETDYPEFWMFGDVPAYGLWARHVEGLRVKDFAVTPRSVNQREKLILDDVVNAQLQ